MTEAPNAKLAWFLGSVLAPLTAAFRGKGFPACVPPAEAARIGAALTNLVEIGQQHDTIIRGDELPAGETFTPVAPALAEVTRDFAALIMAWGVVAERQAAAQDAHIRLAMLHQVEGIARPCIAGGGTSAEDHQDPPQIPA